MIELHRLGAGPAPFHLNPDLIVTVEATPDTTIALTTGTKVLVAEGVEAVVAAVRDWRAGVLAGAYSRSNASHHANARGRSAVPRRSPDKNAHEGRYRHRNRRRCPRLARGRDDGGD